MQTRLEPPITQWPTPAAERPIWTGHQLTLFHPGIVAKYLAAETVSAKAGVTFHNIVVDQDVYDPLKLTLPQLDPTNPKRLRTQTLALGRSQHDIPVGMQPAVSFEEINEHLAQWPAECGVDVALLCEAFAGSDTQRSLAKQMDLVMQRLLPSFAAAEPSSFASRLLDDESELTAMLLHNAPRCAKLYNAAVKEFPGAGIKPMSIEPDRVEVPMWGLRWMNPRQRVFVDIADSTPMFITEDGEPLTPASDETTLAPRALLMTALLRRPDRSGLFIHGTGGWSYDRITERWWQAWRGETLAPMALATADVFLDFEGLPVNSPEHVQRAIWRAHHLPHNLDHELGLDDALALEKQELLQHMDDDRDKTRRRSAFRRVHQINRDLVSQNSKVLAEADRAVEDARVGVANAAIAGKRDWSFLLYPSEKIETLRQHIAYPLEDPIPR